MFLIIFFSLYFLKTLTFGVLPPNNNPSTTQLAKLNKDCFEYIGKKMIQSSSFSDFKDFYSFIKTSRLIQENFSFLNFDEKITKKRQMLSQTLNHYFALSYYTPRHCIIDHNEEVNCIVNYNQEGDKDYEPTNVHHFLLGKVIIIKASGRSRNCALLKITRQLKCWDNETLPIHQESNYFSPTDEPVSAFELSNENICVIKEKNHYLECWQFIEDDFHYKIKNYGIAKIIGPIDTLHFSSTPNGQGTLINDLSKTGTCSIEQENKIATCWKWDPAIENDPEKELSIQTPKRSYAALGPILSIIQHDDLTCFIRKKDHEAHCIYGDNTNPHTPLFPAHLGPIQKMVFNQDTVCALGKKDYFLQCLPKNDFQKKMLLMDTINSKPVAMIDIASDEAERFCVIKKTNGQLHCYRWNDPDAPNPLSEIDVPVSLGPVAAIQMTYDTYDTHTPYLCAVEQKGTLHCWNWMSSYNYKNRFNPLKRNPLEREHIDYEFKVFKFFYKSMLSFLP